MPSHVARFLLCAFFLFISSLYTYAADVSEICKSIQSESAADKGLCLVVEPTDTNLIIALAKTNNLHIQGLSKKSDSIQSSRQHLLKAGIAQRSSFQLTDVDFLPYADNLINIVIAQNYNDKSASLEEFVRVLIPTGFGFIACETNPDYLKTVEEKLKGLGIKNIKSLSIKGWLCFTKPENPDFDCWTQNFGGPDLSSSNQDNASGPWEELRWVGDPRWGALAGTYSGRVTGGGRIYYAEQRSTQAFWVARDAYNGTELWRNPLEGKGWVPLQGPGNTLACDENWVYATHKNILMARDGKTGQIVKEYNPGIAARNNTVCGKFLLTSDIARNIVKNGTLVVMNKESGEIVWKKPTVAHAPAVDNFVCVVVDHEAEGIELSTGKSLWKTPLPTVEGYKKCFLKGNYIYVQYQAAWKPVGHLTVLNLKTGAILWQRDNPGCNYATIPFKDSLVMMDTNKELGSAIVDPNTGNKVKELVIKGFSGKCYPTTASGKFLIYSNCSYLNAKTGEEVTLQNVRSPCFLGHLPSYGLTYFLPHHCDCGISLRGFLAMAPAGKRKWLNDPENAGTFNLVKVATAPQSIEEKPEDWPIYRKNIARSNASVSKVRENLSLLWSEKLANSRLSQAVSAYGLVLTTDSQSHIVFARDANTGKEKWSYIADGRIDYSPALTKGLCIFTTNTGFVIALDALTGKEIYRLRAAPAEKYIAEEGQFASAWPVIGGVMPLNGEVFFSCGRSYAVDGGIKIFAMDAATGNVRYRVKGGTSGDMFLSDGKELHLTKRSYHIQNGTMVNGNKAYGSNDILRTTHYLNPVALTDYMACVEPSLSSEKHIELTAGKITGENIAFNENGYIAAWRYRFGVPADMMKKDKHGQRFIYSNDSIGKLKWLKDENIQLQMMGVIIAGDIAVLAGQTLDKSKAPNHELWLMSLADGKNIQTITLPNAPSYDGLSLANSKLYLATEDGVLLCFGSK